MKKYIFILLLALLSFSFSQAQTRSFKRGVGYNTLMAGDVKALAPGLTWGYNWGHTGSGNDDAFKANNFEFVPMAWNGINKSAIRTYLTTHPEIKYILGFNEPNFKSQSNLTPAQAAAKWPDIEEIANEFGLTIVGPAVNYSPDAPYQDPLKWYDEFFQACPNCRVDHIAIHLYMPSMSSIRSSIESFKKYNRPIWLTEFCAWESTTTLSSQKQFLIETIDYLETESQVFRYAWFKERGYNDGHPYLQLLDARNEGVLKELGEIYVNMSSYNDNYYFTTERQIPAEHYVRMKGIGLEKTTDESDHIHVSEFDVNDWVDYNVNVPTAGEYNIFFRLADEYGDASEVKVSVNDKEVASMLFENKGLGVWNTQRCKAVLAAGKQKIRISFKRGGLKLNWWAISKNEQAPAGVESIATDKNQGVLYPNPVTDKLHVQFPDNSIVTIYDLSGKKLLESKLAGSVIDVSSLKTGVYMVALQPVSGQRTVYKIIKK